MAGVPVKVLGRGANVLISDDGYNGLVVRLDAPAFRKVEFCGDQALVGAGVDLMAFARKCARDGRAGIERLAGIPATIGGAIRMNAGGRHGETKDIVRAVTVMEPSGELRTLTGMDCNFSYRHSAIGESNIIVSAVLDLPLDEPARVREAFERNLVEKQRTQPLAEHSAGCVFKNPRGQSAGAIIDRAGLKGTSRGRAKVSDVHANFIIADHGAKAADVLALIDLVRERVRLASGVELELEIDVWQPEGERSAA